MNYEEIYLNKIQELCGNKLVLSREDVCSLLNISMSTLNRRAKVKTGLPKYNKIGGSITFMLHDVIKYLISEFKI